MNELGESSRSPKLEAQTYRLLSPDPERSGGRDKARDPVPPGGLGGVSGGGGGEPYIRRVTEIYKDRPPSGLDEMRAIDRERVGKTPKAVQVQVPKSEAWWKGRRAHDALVYVSLAVSLVALLLAGPAGVGSAAKGGGAVNATARERPPLIWPYRHPYLSHPLLHPLHWLPLPWSAPNLPPSLARIGLSLGMTFGEVANRTRLALELREGEWLVAEAEDGEEEEKVVFAVDWANVLEQGAAAGDEASVDVAMARGLYPGFLGNYRATRSVSTSTITSTILATATATITAGPAPPTPPRDPTLQLDLEAERTRRDWRRREQDLARREAELGVREEEVRRREVWVLDEIRWVRRKEEEDEADEQAQKNVPAYTVGQKPGTRSKLSPLNSQQAAELAADAPQVPS